MKTKHRFIENGPVVVDIATKTFPNLLSKGRITIKVKAIARVNSESGDVYNPEVGKKLAALRAEVKLAEKYNRIITSYKKYLLDHINPVIDKSLKGIEDAQNELTEYLQTI